jgi:hypothetical protein
LGFAGCQQEWSAEKAERKIDQAAEKTGEKIEGAEEAHLNFLELAQAILDCIEPYHLAY